MLVVVASGALLVAGIVELAGVLSKEGAAHPPTEDLRVRISPRGEDRHVVPLKDRGRRDGAAAPTARPPGPPSASGGNNARFAATRFRREIAFANRVRDTRLEHQRRADSAAVAPRRC